MYSFTLAVLGMHPVLPASLKLKCFFSLFVEFDCGSTSTPLWPNPTLHPRAPYFSSDGEEMDDGKRLILVARTSVKLTNGSPKLGKPLAD